MKGILDKISDWIAAKPYRYWVVQWLLNCVTFFAAYVTVAFVFKAISWPTSPLRRAFLYIPPNPLI